MIDIIGMIFLAAFLGLTAFAAYKHATFSEDTVSSNGEVIFFVRTKPHEFGAKNNGVSMDNREIYSLSLEELGL